MTLWSQTLDQVHTAHPLYGLTSKGPLPAALGVIGGAGLAVRYDAPLIGIGLGLLLVVLPWIITVLLERSRIRFELTQTAAIRHQGAFESSLPFGAEVNYTLSRGPIRRALNLPGVLHLDSQTGVMRSLSLTWPIAATEMRALDTALKTALKTNPGGNRT